MTTVFASSLKSSPAIIGTMFLLVGPSPAVAAEYAKGKISRNVYRIPYASSMELRLGGNDYVNHGGSMDSVAEDRACTRSAATPCSDNTDCRVVGGTCIAGYCAKPCITDLDCGQNGGTCDYVLVAPADGVVCQTIEHYNDCGCNRPVFGSFGNTVTILHANAEMTRFLHVKQWSASLFGITPGMVVRQGQPVAIEGAVGNTCGSTSPSRTGNCMSEIAVLARACQYAFPFVLCESDEDCGPDEGPCVRTDCGRHIHWNITRFTTGEVVNPFTCGIPGNIYQPNSNFLAPCGAIPPAYASNATLSPTTSLNGPGIFRVLQAHNTITASTATISNQASLVLHAGNKVTLLPGFRVFPDGYFRAEIESPDRTAPSQRPMPDDCPCSNAVEFCYQWSDPSSADGVAQGCATPGPQSDKCHGCPVNVGGSGGQRCCGCLMAGDCQP